MVFKAIETFNWKTPITINSNQKADTLEIINTSNLDPFHKYSIGNFQKELNCIFRVNFSALYNSNTQMQKICYNLRPKLELILEMHHCFDRSRLMEEILNHYNYTTRHAFILDISDGIASLFTPRTPTHAS